MDDGFTIRHGRVEADENVYVRRSDDEIADIASGCVMGTLFGSWQMESGQLHLLQSVFMPLMLMSDDIHKELRRDGICHFYGDMADAAPRAINGLPMFMKMHMLNAEDGARVSARMATIRAPLSAR